MRMRGFRAVLASDGRAGRIADMATLNKGFSDDLAQALELEGFDITVEPTIKGLTPDFVVRLSTGRLVVLEAKHWEASEPNLNRAQRQAEFYRDNLGFSDVFVVLPSVPSDSHTEFVVGLDRLGAFLRQLESVPFQESPADPVVEPAKPVMFCAMPFDSVFDDVFHYAMRSAAEDSGLTARRVDQEEYLGGVESRIRGLIRESAVVVADLSGSNPNVTYEVGYADGLGKPVVLICSTPFADSPFNVAHLNTLEYAQGQTNQLAQRLATRVTTALSGS